MRGRETQWAEWMRAAGAGDSAAYDRCPARDGAGLAASGAARTVSRRGKPGRNGGRGAGYSDRGASEAAHLGPDPSDRAVDFRHRALQDHRQYAPPRLPHRIADRGFRRNPAGGGEPKPQANATSRARWKPCRKASATWCARSRSTASSISDTALKLNMSEGAVRVSLHRGLGALAKRHRDDT